MGACPLQPVVSSLAESHVCEWSTDGMTVCSGELPYDLVLDGTGKEFTPAQNVERLPATTDPVRRQKARLTLSK